MTTMSARQFNQDVSAAKRRPVVITDRGQLDGRIIPVELTVTRRAARLHVPDRRPERDA